MLGSTLIDIDWLHGRAYWDRVERAWLKNGGFITGIFD